MGFLTHRSKICELNNLESESHSLSPLKDGNKNLCYQMAASCLTSEENNRVTDSDTVNPYKEYDYQIRGV